MKFPKGSVEAKEYMAKIRAIAKEKRLALAKEVLADEATEIEPIKPVEIEPIKPKRVYKKKVVAAAEPPLVEEPLVVPVEIETSEEPPVVPVEIETSEEPAQVIKKTRTPKKVVDKPIIVKAPKKVKKIIIEEDDKEQYEVEYRKSNIKTSDQRKKNIPAPVIEPPAPFENPLLSRKGSKK